MKMGVNGNPGMFLEIIKFLGQEDVPWDEILPFFHLHVRQCSYKIFRT